MTTPDSPFTDRFRYSALSLVPTTDHSNTYQ